MSETSLGSRPGAADSGVVKPATADAKRILLVEGDGFTRLVLLLRLRLAGFAVDFTSNGILGLGKLRNCHPDVLLVELKLCGLSGLDLIKAARAEPGFDNRPIYVFTHVDRLSRTARKEVESLATKVFDKKSVTREELVQAFAATFSTRETKAAPSASRPGVSAPAAAISEVVLSGALEELVAGVQEQSKVLARDKGSRAASAGELLSRVSSLASCASEAGVPDLARQAKALNHFLDQLGRHEGHYTNAALTTVARAVDVMAHLPIEAADRASSLSRFKAVYVDEAPYSNRAMEEALLQAGFDPACFENSVRAQEHLAANRTDLIVANIVLPEAHGLALSDIRRLPWHARTPVLYGNDSTFAAPPRGELPTSAPRLDHSPVLLAELVLRCLNEVQSRNTGAVPAVPAKKASTRTVPHVPQAARPDNSAQEDGFELFTRGASPAPALAMASETDELSTPAQELSGAEPGAPEEQPMEVRNEEGLHVSDQPAAESEEPFSQFFIPARAPVQPVQPGMLPEDRTAESAEHLPVHTTDEIHLDHQAVEASSHAGFAAHESLPPQPEQLNPDQAAETEWVAAAGGEAGEGLAAGSYDTQVEQREAGAVQETAADTSNNADDMNNRLHTMPAGQGVPGESLDSQLNQDQDLAARVCAAEMSLYHAQKQMEQKDHQIEALQTQMAAQAANRGAASDPAIQGRCSELEQEVAALRQALEGLGGEVPQPASAEAAAQVEALEKRLADQQAETEQQKEAQRRLESDLRQQLETAQKAARENEQARRQFEGRAAELEQQLAALRQAREDAAKQTTKPGQTESSGTPATDLEHQVREGVAALAHATAELARERGERQRAQQLAADLNARLQALHLDLNRTLQTQGEHLARIGALEQQQQQATQALERCAADLEQEEAERGLAETQLLKAKEANAQLRKDLSFFEETNNKFGGARQDLQARLEGSLQAARESEARLQQETAERRRVEQALEESRRDLQNQARKRESLEQELQGIRDALQEREATLQKEAAERRRLSENLDAAQRGLHDGPERDLEFSKLQAALQSEQVERKRQESKLARMRQSTLDAAHAARSLRTSLRRQVREPVDNLVQSARSLLEMEMGDHQKKLAEAVLQDVLLVQTRLREPARPLEDAPEPAATPPNTTP
jgi:DNA-binding response OmpR family regulator